MATVTGGELIARMLKAEGVGAVFGIQDGTYVRLCAALVDQGIDFVTPRHETAAAHMAGAYARLTGGLGVCIASNGPGVANVLPGVAVENAEGNRVLLITSSRRSGITYPDRGGTYQYFDQVGVIGPMAKWSASAPTFDRIPELLRRALRRCWSGRPGVVHLDVPESVVNGEHDWDGVLLEPRQYRRTAPVAAPEDGVEEAARILAGAVLPVIHSGGGVVHAGAGAEVIRLAEILHAPVTTSWSGRGGVPETNPLVWPMTLVDAVDSLRSAADAVLCLGSRLGETDWWGKQPNWRRPGEQALVQVDVDDDVLGQNKALTLGVQADVKEFLTALADRLEKWDGPVSGDARVSSVDALAAERDAAAAELRRPLEDVSAPMVTAHLAVACQEVFGDDAVAVFDGGNTAVWGNFFHTVRVPNCVLGTAHMGMLGAGVGQATGAAVARPGKPVYCIIGDGAFGMHMQEVETAVRNGLPVTFVVAADCQWGMVKLTQIVVLGTEGVVNADLAATAYDDLARAMGAHGERVSDPGDLVGALERCRDTGGASVVHVEVDPMKHLWAPGLATFKKMHEEPAGEAGDEA